MAWRPHGRATVNAKAPSAFGICDRCGLLYNLEKLVWQFDWRGNRITNIRIRVCTVTCYDKPYEGNRPLKLPPDPLPVKDARPIQYALDEENTPPTSPTYWDEPGILWDNGETEWAP